MKTENKKNKTKNVAFLKRVYKSPSFGIVSVLLLMCIVLAIATPRFLDLEQNLLPVIRSFSFTALMALGECLVIITGGIDLSVGSVFAFSGVVSCMSMVNWGMPMWLGVIIGIACGAVLGLMNGLFITKLKLPPFIATLGMMSIARGLAYTLTEGYPVNNLPESFKFIGQGYIGAIPFPIILLLIFSVIFSVFLRKTIIGRRVYALGGSEEATKFSGINTDTIKMVVYSISGVMSAIAGMATAARLGVAQSTAGSGYEMDAIAAVIIGGASLSGGVGTIFGTIIGAAIMGVLRNGLVLLSVSAYWQQTIIGCVIIFAVTIDQFRHMRNKSK